MKNMERIRRERLHNSEEMKKQLGPSPKKLKGEKKRKNGSASKSPRQRDNEEEKDDE